LLLNLVISNPEILGLGPPNPRIDKKVRDPRIAIPIHDILSIPGFNVLIKPFRPYTKKVATQAARHHKPLITWKSIEKSTTAPEHL